MTLANWSTLKTDTVFVAKVEAATYQAIQSVANEAASDPVNPVKDAKRNNLVTEFNKNPEPYIELFLNYVCTNGVLTVGSPDDAIEFTVNAAVDAIAGYNPNNPAVN